MGLSCDAAARAIRALNCDSVTFFYCVSPKKARCAKKQTLGGETQQQTIQTPMSKKDLDYVLEEVVGGGGRWQWRKWLFLVPTYLAMGAPALLMQMFSAYTPTHR